jgi:hypothetical protein
MIAIPPGTYKIIHVDGSEEIIAKKPSMRALTQEIGAESIDPVTLDRRNQTIMIVDDTGMIDGKPVNSKATELYRNICKPGTVWAIHGDVALVNDEDFA